MTAAQPERAVVAAAQLCSTDDLTENLRVCKELAAEAGGRGARLLSLPECFAFLGRKERDKLGVAEVLDAARPGPILAAMQEMAREHRMWVAGAGIPERIESEREGEATTAYNTLAVVSPEGELAALYRKIHLFDVDIPGRATLRESAATAAGGEVVSVATDVGCLGLSICYDLRFPELYRRLTFEHGAEVLLVPAAFTAHTGAAHWHLLLRARAVENQCYVVAAAQTGKHNEKRESYGHALVVDPWGTVVAEVPDGPGLAVAELDRELLAKTRRQLPSLAHKVLGLS